MKFFIMGIACLVLVAVVFGLNAQQTLDYATGVFDDFADGVNSIKYLFMPNQFKGTVATSTQLGDYVFGDEIIPVIEYIKRNTNYTDDMTIYGNVWQLELKTIIPDQYGEAPAIKYDWSYSWLIDKNHISTVFWCPTQIYYYGNFYEFVVDAGGMQTLYKNVSDLRNQRNGVTRFGPVLAIEENYTVGDFVRKELID